MKDIQGKCIVITGAGSGIGRELALMLAPKGANLALCDIVQSHLDELARELSQFNIEVLTAVVDVSLQQSVMEFSAQVTQRFGAVDVLINNAGVSLMNHALTTTVEDFQWIMSINFWGVIHNCLAFIPHMVKRGSGHVINMSSVYGLVPMSGISAYSASKFAVCGYTESLAQDIMESGVIVTGVFPGAVRTGLIKNGKNYVNMFGDTPDKVDFSGEFVKRARTSPREAAQAILEVILKPKPRLLIGLDAYLLDRCRRSMPGSFPRLIRLLLKIQNWLNPLH